MTYNAARHERWEMAQLDAHLETSPEYDYRHYRNLPYKQVNGEWVDRDGETVDEEDEWIVFQENDKECGRQEEARVDAENAFWMGEG